MESIQESLNSVLTVWVIAWRSVWPLILMFVTVTVCDLLLPSPQPDQPTSPQRGLLLRLWIGPLLLCIWGGINWGAEQSFAENLHWRSGVLSGLALASILGAVWMPCRLRRSMRWQHLIGSILSVLLVVVFWGLGTMALSNIWL
jgi:peptidoglycan/LPS O-acetylase OafA/YrhL